MFSLHEKKTWTLGLFILLALGSAAPIFAQSIWLDQSADRAIYLEIQKPSFTEKYLSGGGFFDPAPKTTFATASIFLSARFRLPGTITLKAELPFINAGLKDYTFIDFLGDTIHYDSYSENEFGNPLVGLEIGVPGSPFSTDFAVRFPIVDEEHSLAPEFGYFSDYDRLEAFWPNLWAFTLGANIKYKGPTGLLLRLRTGPAFFVPTRSGPDAELYADFSLQAGYQGNRVTVLAGYTGRVIITEGDLNLSERTIDQVGLSASYAFGRFSPGILLRVPVDDDLNGIVSSVFGLNVAYAFPAKPL